MNNFKELKIWEKGMEIVREIYTLSKQLPEEERYIMKSQIVRSAVSIPSIIAEGTSRKSQKDFARFIEISLGSCFELETQLLIVKWNYPNINCDYLKLLGLIEEEQKMLTSFGKKLLQNEKLVTRN